MVKLRISADEVDGTLQRAIFEFSRRNIEIERLLYSRENGRIVLHITVKNDNDALKVTKHLKRICGVVEVTAPDSDRASLQRTRSDVPAPQEMLG